MDERQLRQLFDLCDVGWVFDEHATARAEKILQEMRDVDQQYRGTFGRLPDPVVEERVLPDRERLKPFIQSFASPMTTPIRTMILCVLEGAEVKAIRFDYARKLRARLEVDVEYDSGEQASFTSDDLWDAEALRHFGLMKLAEAPVIDGYYAFRKAEP